MNPNDIEPWVRSAGGALQLAGLLTVWFELRDIRQRNLGVRWSLRGWIKGRWNRWRGGAGQTIELQTIRERGQVLPIKPRQWGRRKRSRDRGDRAQFDELFRRTDQLKDQVDDLRHAHKKSQRERIEATNSLNRAIQDLTAEMRAAVRGLATGPLRLRSLGVWLLAAGIAFSNWSGEIADILAGLL